MGIGIAEIAIIAGVFLLAFVFRTWRSYAGRQQQSNEQPSFARPQARKTQNTSQPLPENGIDWAVIADERVARHLPDDKIAAIKAYRKITGIGLKEARDAVEIALAHPEKIKKGFSALNASMSDAGIRDLLAAGKFEDAVTAYRTFTGVDTFTARNAVEDMQRQLYRSDLGAYVDDETIRQALRDGKKLEAVKYYRQLYNVGLREAMEAVNAIEEQE
jgi:ribosomal protein L7/L12